MKLKHLFITHSVIALFNGGSLALIPELYLSLYGISPLNSDAVFIARLLGAALLTYCFVTWFARDAENSTARRAIVLGFFIAMSIGFIVALLGQLSGVMNTLGWVIVALYFLLALGYGYFHFIKQDAR